MVDSTKRMFKKWFISRFASVVVYCFASLLRSYAYAVIQIKVASVLNSLRNSVDGRKGKYLKGSSLYYIFLEGKYNGLYKPNGLCFFYWINPNMQRRRRFVTFNSCTCICVLWASNATPALDAFHNWAWLCRLPIPFVVINFVNSKFVWLY